MKKSSGFVVMFPQLFVTVGAFSTSLDRLIALARSFVGTSLASPNDLFELPALSGIAPFPLDS